jgi:hypothetical protein
MTSQSLLHLFVYLIIVLKKLIANERQFIIYGLLAIVVISDSSHLITICITSDKNLGVHNGLGQYTEVVVVKIPNDVENILKVQFFDLLTLGGLVEVAL